MVLLISAILIICLVAVRYSAHPIGTKIYCQNNQAAHKDCAAYDVLAIPLLEIGKFLDDHNGAVIAIFTIVLAVFTVRLALSTDKLVKGADNTSIRQLRAYVYPEGMVIVMQGNDREIKTRVKNFGQTPAYEVRLKLKAFFAPHPLNVTKIPSGAPELTAGSTGTIPPGSYIEIVNRLPSVKIDEYGLTKESKLAFWIVGTIDYTDAFGKKRFTNARRFSMGDLWDRGAFAFDPDGNESD